MSKTPTAAVAAKTIDVNNCTFSEMVKHLFKPGADICETLSENDADLTHAALGLVTEARELCLAIFANDKVNIKEEIGDYLFYHEAMRQAVGIEQSNATYAIGYDITGFLMQTINAADYVKKVFAYAQEPKRDHIAAILDELSYYVLAIANTHGVSIAEAMEANKVKLLTKRYPNGFSNQAAADRADKADGDK